jgi:hypothetical protein
MYPWNSADGDPSFESFLCAAAAAPAAAAADVCDEAGQSRYRWNDAGGLQTRSLTTVPCGTAVYIIVTSTHAFGTTYHVLHRSPPFTD